MSDAEVARRAKFLYALAAELEPQEDKSYTKIHPATFNKYRRRMLEAIENDDSIAMVELRDSMTQGEWAYFHSRLYTEHGNEVKRLCDIADELETG